VRDRHIWDCMQCVASREEASVWQRLTKGNWRSERVIKGGGVTSGSGDVVHQKHRSLVAELVEYWGSWGSSWAST